MTRRIVVIGGGVGGLSAAYYARKANPEATITVLEASAEFGGVTKTRRPDGLVLEEGPDSIIRIKPAGLQLLTDLGLDQHIQATQPQARQSFIVRAGRLVPVPEGLYLMAPGRWWPFLWTRLVSWSGKIRMGLDLLIPRRRADAPEESLAAFVRRRLGREALERIAQPMVGGIYTADPERLSLQATMPQFVEMEREHRSLLLAMRRRAKAMAKAPGGGGGTSGPRYGLFMSLPGGLGDLVAALQTALSDCDLRTEASVRGLVRVGDQWQVQLDAGEVAADEVVLALPAHAAAPVVRSADSELAELLQTIPYAGVATVNLVYPADAVERLPDGAGFVVPSVEHRAILACTNVTCKYPGRAPEGTVILRAFVGGGLHEVDLEADDEQMVARCVAELRDLVGLRGEPQRVHVARWPRAMAQHVLGHEERLAAIRARERALTGLHLVGNGYEGVGIPDIVAQGKAIWA
ncbi:MAG: protoporphyrinogen oxidase [Planctomycetota bacterium]|jgi:oxygen-dependent protoporphyrinogen oxidase|nr:protoporphyrinogen oxidase [Planctomycetota bacterium]